MATHGNTALQCPHQGYAVRVGSSTFHPTKLCSVHCYSYPARIRVSPVSRMPLSLQIQYSSSECSSKASRFTVCLRCGQSHSIVYQGRNPHRQHGPKEYKPPSSEAVLRGRVLPSMLLYEVRSRSGKVALALDLRMYCRACLLGQEVPSLYEHSHTSVVGTEYCCTCIISCTRDGCTFQFLVAPALTTRSDPRTSFPPASPRRPIY
jgi:hypothetical protein